MAARFWVGGTGTWDGTTTTHWSASTGGASGASAPTSSDTATFDSASGLGATTVTVASTAAASTVTITGPANQQCNFSFSGNVTWTTLSVTGNSAQNKVVFQSSVASTQRTLTVTTITALSNMVFIDIKGAGTGVWTGTAIGDGLNNSGITFSPRTVYWVATTGGSWSSTASWSTSTGGGSGAAIPIPGDTAMFDANSISGAARVITVDCRHACTHIDLSAVTNTPSFTLSQNTNLYGNMTLGTITCSGSFTFFLLGRSAQTFTSNSVQTSAFSFQHNGVGGTYTLQDNYNTTANLAVSGFGATFDPNGKNVTVGTQVTHSGGTIRLGTNSTWTLTGTGTVWSGSSTTTTSGSSTILITDTSATAKTFAGGGHSFDNITITGGGSGTVTFTGANTFKAFTVTGPKSIILPSSTTTTVTNLAWHGSAGNLVTVTASSPGTAATISSSTGGIVCDWLSLTDSTATGGATFWAGANSTSVSGNTGWTFTAPAVSKTATLTASGAATKSSLLPLAGTASYVGAFVKSSLLPLTGSLDFVGAIARIVAYILTAALSFTGSVARALMRAVTATLSFTGSVARSTTRALTGAANFVGAEAASTRRALAGSLSFAGAITRQTLRRLTATLSSAGALQRFLTRGLTATLSSGGTLARSLRRKVTASLAFVGALPHPRLGVLLSAVLSFVGTRRSAATRTLTGTLPLTPRFAKLPKKLHRASVGFAGVFATHMRVSRLLINGALGFAGSIAHNMRHTRLMVGALTFTTHLARASTRLLTATLGFSGQILKRANRLLTGAVSSSGAVLRRLTRSVSAALALAGTIQRRTSRSLAGALSQAGSIAKSSRRSLLASVASAGSLLRRVSVPLTAGLASSGAIVKRALSRSLTSAVSFTISSSRRAARTFTAVVTSTGAFRPRIGLLLTGALSFAGGLPFTLARVLRGALTALGHTQRSSARSLSSILWFSSSARRVVGSRLLSTLSFAGSTMRTRLVILGSAALGFAGAIHRRTRRSLTAALSFTDYLNLPFRYGASLLLFLVHSVKSLVRSDPGSHEVVQVDEDAWMIVDLLPQFVPVEVEPDTHTEIMASVTTSTVVEVTPDELLVLTADPGLTVTQV